VLGLSGNYTKCCHSKTCPSLIATKSFVQPKYADHSVIHDFVYKKPWYSVGPGVTAANSDKTYTKIWINHYSVKSLEDYQMKMKRGSGNDVHRRMNFFEMINNQTTENCPVLFMPPSISYSKTNCHGAC